MGATPQDVQRKPSWTATVVRGSDWVDDASRRSIHDTSVRSSDSPCEKDN